MKFHLKSSGTQQNGRQNSVTTSSKIQYLRDKVLSKRAFQIVAFLIVLALTILVIRIFVSLDLKETFVRYGYLGAFLLTLGCSATIIFPLPGEAVILVMASILNPLWLALVTSVGGTLGEVTGYLAGYLGRKTIIERYAEKYARAELWMKKYGGLGLFIFALSPFLIFDFVGIAAGVLRFPLWKFFLACWAGRIIRMLLLTYLGWAGFGRLLPELFR